MGKYQVHQTDRNQKPLVDWLLRRGCLYEHIGEPVDGLLCVPVRGGWLTVPVEFKGLRGQLRASQRQFLDRWCADAYVLRTELECAAMLAELKYLDPNRTGR